MTNVYLKEGMTIGAALSETVNFLNDTGSLINSGQPVKIGNQQMGIALVDIGVGNNNNVARHGIFRLSKNTNQVITQASAAFLFTSDIHFLADKVVTPNRNPDFYA